MKITHFLFQNCHICIWKIFKIRKIFELKNKVIIEYKLNSVFEKKWFFVWIEPNGMKVFTWVALGALGLIQTVYSFVNSYLIICYKSRILNRTSAWLISNELKSHFHVSSHLKCSSNLLFWLCDLKQWSLDLGDRCKSLF